VSAGAAVTAESGPALEALCRAYWFPLYAFLRRAGRDHEDAQDLVQGFFARLLERGDLGRVTPEGGKFRSYLLTALKHFLINVRQHQEAQKRGGGRPTLSLDLDFADAHRRYLAEPSSDVTPERLYEQRWALTLLEKVLAGLREELEESGARNRYGALEGFLPGGRRQMSYEEAAEQLGISVGAVKVAVHRLRTRYRRRFRKTVADTLARPDDVGDEIRHILDVLAS
jgi:RNA polymerase sigma-70 factor (ECF subfamily)